MKKIVKIAGISFIIAAIAVGIIIVKGGYLNNLFRNNDILMPSTALIDEDDYLERLKLEKSEIPGMSKYDKLIAGLDPDNSDTDHDGLEDVDELNIYHSDPTKMSTADDLYTDGYKVENGMDVNTKYAYVGEPEFKWNNCDEITLKAKTIKDLSAVVEKITPDDKEKELGVCYKYRIYNYSNTVSIDMKNAIGDSISKIGVYSYKLGDTAEKAKYTIEHNTMTLTKALNPDDMYYIYIVDEGIADKNNIKEEIANFNRAKAVVSDIQTVNLTAFATYWSLPVAAERLNGYIFRNTKEPKLGYEHVYILSSGNRQVDNATLKDMVDALNYAECVPEEMYFTTSNVACTIVTSREQYDKLFKKKTAFHKENPRVEWNRGLIVPAYFTYDDFLGDYMFVDDGGIDKMEYIEAEGYGPSFDLERETLPFGNFATSMAPEGTCMGICTLTAKLHNDKTLPPSGSLYVSSQNRDVQWDLTTSDENETLMNTGLSDYMYDSFIKDRRGSDHLVSAQTDGEAQFFNMISCYWQEGNDTIKQMCNYRYPGKTNYDISGLEPVIKQLDDHKVLICGLGQGEGAHAVIVYDYDKTEDGTIYFYVYDCNYPGLASQDLRIKITPKQMDYSFTDSFEFEYETPDYKITSVNAEKYVLMFVDEDWNAVMCN